MRGITTVLAIVVVAAFGFVQFAYPVLAGTENIDPPFLPAVIRLRETESYVRVDCEPGLKLINSIVGNSIFVGCIHVQSSAAGNTIYLPVVSNQ